MKIHQILCFLVISYKSYFSFAGFEFETTVTDKIIKHNQSIEVIEAKENESIQSVLSRSASVEALAQGSHGRIAGLFLSGLASEHFSLLINGFPIHDLSAPSASVNYSELDFTGQIEKIEIYRGGTAIRFGEQALGGVINIVLREKIKNITGSIGSENYKAVAAGYGKESLFIGANHSSTSGISDANEKYGNVEKDSNLKNSAVVIYRLKTSDERSLDILYRHANASIDYDLFGGPAGDSLTSFYKVRTNQLSVKSAAKQQQPYYSILLTENSRTDQSNASFVSRNEQASVGILSIPFFGGEVFSEAQFEAQTADVSGSSFSNFAKRREQVSAALDYRNKQNSMYMGLGQRYFCRNQELFKWSDITCFPGSVVYLGSEVKAFSWLLTGQRSTRRPSMFQLYSNIGNLNLKEEELSSVLFEAKPVFGYFSMFYHQIKNQIVYRTSYQNIAETQIYGLEAGYNVDFRGQWGWSQNVSYSRAIDVQNKRDLLRRSPIRVNSMMGYNFDEFYKFDIQYQYRAGALDINSFNEYITMPNVHNLNCAVHYKNSTNESYRLELNNILNDRTEQVWGYGVYGFNIQFVFSKSWM